MNRVGYARVSLVDQHPEAQRERLLAAGCDPDLIFTDLGASGAKASRPAWDQRLAQLRAGDILVAVRLDRIGRSLRNLLDVVCQLAERQLDLEILDQSLSTATPAGRMIFAVLTALAEYERELLIERTKDGLAATRAAAMVAADLSVLAMPRSPGPGSCALRVTALPTSGPCWETGNK